MTDEQKAALVAELDTIGVAKEVQEIEKVLDITNDAAIKLVSDLLEAGYPPDELDVIPEYGTQLSRAGLKDLEPIIREAYFVHKGILL